MTEPQTFYEVVDGEDETVGSVRFTSAREAREFKREMGLDAGFDVALVTITESRRVTRL